MDRLVALLASRRAQAISVTVMAGLGVVWILARFWRLSDAPPSFWMDEAWDAVHAMCLAQTGRDGAGNPWPLFSPAMGGGNLPITWTAFAIGWTKVFGTSRVAFRSASAFWVLVTSAGLFAIARSLVTLARDSAAGDWARRFPWLVLLAALVSSWSFQFSRISWEGPLAPAFLVLALAALLRLRNTGRLRWAMLGGTAAGLAMISYPPMRVTAPLVLVLGGAILLAIATKGAARRALLIRLAVMAAMVAVVISPVVVLTLRGEITSRTMDVAIFAPSWLDEHRGGVGRVPFFFITLLDHLALHLRPSYLFFTGDGNFRHSPHVVGQLSPLDSLAVLLTLAFLAQAAWRGWRRTANPMDTGGGAQLLMAVAVVAFLCGLFAALPAALTWDGVPHALRSIGAWPFVALFTGAVLTLAWSWRGLMPVVVAATVLVYSAAYLPLYARAYRTGDPSFFHSEIMQAIEAGRAARPPLDARASIVPLLSRHGDETLRYFLMQYDGLSCQEAAQALRDLREQ